MGCCGSRFLGSEKGVIMLEQLLKELKLAGDPERSKAFVWFFKTGKGEYGEGDIFLGITVPHLRSISKNLKTFKLIVLKNLLIAKFMNIGYQR